MSLLSKSEVQFLQGTKQVSKSYEYKLKSIIKKKLDTLLDKELPLISSLFPNLDLTKFGKFSDIRNKCLTKFSKNDQVLVEEQSFKAPGPGFEPGSRE